MVIRLSRFLPAAAASAVVASVIATRPLGSIPRAIAVAGVVLSWVLSVAVRRRDVRTHASVVTAIAGVTAAGEVDGGWLYGASCAVFLFACLASMRAARSAIPDSAKAPGLPSPGEDGAKLGHGARPMVRVVVTLVVSGAAVTAGMLAGLPRLAHVIENRMNAMFGASFEETTAFSTTMVLGATRGMLLSSTIVMRIDGGRPEYLRGAVYDRYHGRFWTTSTVGRERTHARGADGALSTTKVVLARGAPNGEDMRWFLPPGACDLALAGGGGVEIDGFGVARRTSLREPVTIAFRTEGCRAPPGRVSSPSANDLEVPADIDHRLRPVAALWSKDARSDRQKLDAIARELGQFAYSLEVARDASIDPIVDFVTVHRAGHCEFFAGAMALLARTQGIPTRVVGGYRVSEVNPLTHHAVVRDRNAHTWVEAWVDGAWRAWDPTPTSESIAPRASLLEAFADVAGQLVDRITLLDTGVALAALAVTFWLGRAGARFARRRTRPSPTEATGHAPLPCFVALSDALARAGHVRGAAEPVETFADRLREAGAPWANEVAGAFRAYATLCYGGIGDERALTALMGSLANVITVSGRKPSSRIPRP